MINIVLQDSMVFLIHLNYFKCNNPISLIAFLYYVIVENKQLKCYSGLGVKIAPSFISIYNIDN